MKSNLSDYKLWNEEQYDLLFDADNRDELLGQTVKVQYLVNHYNNQLNSIAIKIGDGDMFQFAEDKNNEKVVHIGKEDKVTVRGAYATFNNYAELMSGEMGDIYQNEMSVFDNAEGIDSSKYQDMISDK